ncbi:UvrD-helicase domain-containing protein [Actinoallomurus sp. NPDC050550]|uniref:UvrD-helicase domain-containing protein n=1 Tax=Actinoallomurus sp. NPDC050550 TaxID=3154937 RepID=UPI0033DBDCD8
MAKLGIHQNFLQDLVRLDRPVQEKVAHAIAKFGQATHAGIHLEKIANARDDRLKSIRIDRFWRGVVLVPEAGDQFTLLKVLPHDDAYDWAGRHQASVNTATGQIEIRDVVAIETTTDELVRTADHGAEPLFAHVSDADFIRLGLDEQMRAFARLLTSLEPLDAISNYVPRSQYDVLYGLAAGYSPEQVWDMVSADDQRSFDPEDITGAVERTPSKVVLVDGPEELMALLRKPFAHWRIYLHPTQRKAAYGTYSGPAQVTGGPGTGKTVVALHRARLLASRGGRVLLTTFTGTLAESLLDNLRLLENDEEILSRIDVRTVDQVASRIVREHHGRYAIVDDAEERDLWRRTIRHRAVPYSETFIAEEWRQVVLAQNLTTLDEYLAARRTGRGRRLGSLQRTQVWRVISEFEQELAEHKWRTYETVCVEATRILSEQNVQPYDHVVVDEAQDLHPVRWRLLRAAVPSGPDDIFVAGDTHQRIYDNRVSLRSVGVPVSGRSTNLTINYRTTAEILSWSHGVLTGEQMDDLDEGTISLTGFRSEMHGAEPGLSGATAKKEELDRLAGKVRAWLAAGVKPEEIGVAARSSTLAREAAGALSRDGVAVRYLTRDHGGVDGQVHVMTMHRMKGLEYRCVAVIGVSEHQVPAPGSVRKVEDDEVAHLHDLQRERCLLFVACTRAREDLYVSWHGTPSGFLP